MGQTPAGSGAGEGARVGAAGQCEHGAAHPARCRVVTCAERAGQEGGSNGENRTADEPGQTLNVDLCFVPAVHAVAAHLPVVSGSSGRLVVYGPRPSASDAERTWPGQVFANLETAYERAMREFVWRSAPRTPVRTVRQRCQEATEHGADRALRQQRRQEDAAWRDVCRERQARLRPARWTPRQHVAYLAAEDYFLFLQERRQATLARRQQRRPPRPPGSRSWS